MYLCEINVQISICSGNSSCLFNLVLDFFFLFFLISSKARPPYLNFFFKFITKNKTKKTKRPDLVYNVVGRVQK